MGFNKNKRLLQGGAGDFSAAEIATADVVYEIARLEKKKQVSRKKKSVGRGSNAAHFTYNMRHVHHMHRTTAYPLANLAGSLGLCLFGL
jgi:hypothetical protein